HDVLSQLMSSSTASRTSTSTPFHYTTLFRSLAETASRHGVTPQLWLPSFGLTREDIPELEAAIESGRAAGVEDLWTWGYEACGRSEEHTSELQSRGYLVCRLLLEKKKLSAGV